jgi:hypothetical protein
MWCALGWGGDRRILWALKHWKGHISRIHFTSWELTAVWWLSLQHLHRGGLCRRGALLHGWMLRVESFPQMLWRVATIMKICTLDEHGTKEPWSLARSFLLMESATFLGEERSMERMSTRYGVQDWLTHTYALVQGFSYTVDIHLIKKKIALLRNTRCFLLNNQSDALIIQIYSVIKLYMFQASSLSIIRSFLLYVRHW